MRLKKIREDGEKENLLFDQERKISDMTESAAVLIGNQITSWDKLSV